jgi:hypothetical protein
MNISDAAVEAAAEAMHDRDAYAELFEDAPEHRRARYLDAARGILEAAAPYLIPEVLDESNDSEYCARYFTKPVPVPPRYTWKALK